MSILRKADRQRLRQVFAFRCAYCGISESDVGAELTEDHFQPISHGGTNDFGNLVYACHACNEFKGDYWNPAGLDRILHPLDEDVATHIIPGEGGLLDARTQTGAFHIRRLHLNRPGLVAYRQDRIALEAGAARIAAIEREIGDIRMMLQELLEQTGAVSSDSNL